MGNHSVNLRIQVKQLDWEKQAERQDPLNDF